MGYRFQIENLDRYPDYVFLLQFRFPLPGYRFIEPGDHVGFYYRDSPVVHAIKREHFRAANLPSLSARDSVLASPQLPPGGLVHVLDSIDNALAAFFDTTSGLLTSDLVIRAATVVSREDPRIGNEDVIRIKSLSDSQFELVFHKVIFTFKDGTMESRSYGPDGKRPEPSAAMKWVRMAWSVLLPGGAFF